MLVHLLLCCTPSQVADRIILFLRSRWFIFPDYFIPGICLFLFIGILPALAFWGSIYRSEPKFLERLNVYKDRFWSWTFSFYASIGLLIWINIQIIIIGYQSFIQGFYALVGILMLIVVSLPGVVNHYHK